MADVFTYRSIIDASPGDVFRWHERDDALLDLTPSRRCLRVESRSGGLRDGGQVDFSVGIGPLRIRWRAVHYGYVAGRQFCDEQVRGPFALWRHQHRFEPVGEGQTLYEDRVEYAVPGGRFAQKLASPLLRRLLQRMFASRHRTVAARVTGIAR